MDIKHLHLGAPRPLFQSSGSVVRFFREIVGGKQVAHAQSESDWNGTLEGNYEFRPCSLNVHRLLKSPN